MTLPAYRWVVPLFGLAALLLVPWVVLLVLVLPSAHQSAHWDIAWSGFDVALALLLSAVAVAAWRGPQLVEGAANAAAAVLVLQCVVGALEFAQRVALLVSVRWGRCPNV